jgi:hypothetical protein
MTIGAPQAVDRKNAVIKGYVVAQLGPFKTPGRGEFTRQSLETIVALMRQESKGLKVRYTHPTLSEDGLGKYLGRSKAARLDRDRVRADLHFDKSAFKTPNGDLATYVMDLAESDPDAISSSLALQADELDQRDEKGRLLVDDDGEPLAPIWIPTKLHASDIVEVGDAVDSLLSADGLPDQVVRAASQLLDQQFPTDSPDVIRARCVAWLDRYLGWRFPQAGPSPLELMRKKLAEAGIKRKELAR